VWQHSLFKPPLCASTDPEANNGAKATGLLWLAMHLPLLPNTGLQPTRSAWDRRWWKASHPSVWKKGLWA